MGILNPYACIENPIAEDEYLTRNSEQFHAHLGFEKTDEFHKCGCKFGRWYNMIWMEKIIGEHAKPRRARRWPSSCRWSDNLGYDYPNIVLKSEALWFNETAGHSNRLELRMDFLYGPNESPEPTGFEPLEWDDSEYEDEYTFEDSSDDSYEEEEYEEPGFGGWDDLKPFASFDDESSWSDGYL